MIETGGLRMRWWILLPLATIAGASSGQQPGADAETQPPPVAPSPHDCGGEDGAPRNATLLPGYGGGGFPISTRVKTAQAWFDNGMQLAHAFAHKAAIAAMAEAVRLDPECAMCAWGHAWAAGPTINYPVGADETKALAVEAEKAQRLAAAGPERERLLADALVLRYRRGNAAFARAMDAIAARYPEDDSMLTLAADAWMTLDSNADRTDHTGREVALLETVLRRSPDYTPAIHFYIHATEIGGFPERAESYADRLPKLAPAASHLIHMPSHTYYHVGRYQDAVDANVRAVEIGHANAKRLGLPEDGGVWELPYHAHNVHYGVGAALISGDGSSALALSDPLVARTVDGRANRHGSFGEMIAGMGFFAQARFADPATVLALARPAAAFPFATAYWHYARGEAQARLGRAAAVRLEAAATQAPAGKRPKEDFAFDAAKKMVVIARLVLEGRAAMLDQDPRRALAAFAAAAKLQESKPFAQYADPPAFWYPVRRDVAQALFALGRSREALAAADAALEAMPKEPGTMAIRARISAALAREGQRLASR
jgi:tetratricopeptide (TPR) repeat protein